MCASRTTNTCVQAKAKAGRGGPAAAAVAASAATGAVTAGGRIGGNRAGAGAQLEAAAADCAHSEVVPDDPQQVERHGGDGQLEPRGVVPLCDLRSALARRPCRLGVPPHAPASGPAGRQQAPSNARVRQHSNADADADADAGAIAASGQRGALSHPPPRHPKQSLATAATAAAAALAPARRPSSSNSPGADRG